MTRLQFLKSMTIYLTLIFLILSGCSPYYESAEIPYDNRSDEGNDLTRIDKWSDRKLCGSLHRIKEVPYAVDGPSDDPIFSEIRKRKDSILECLVGQITNETPMKDPMTAPKYRGFVVGDCAVFLLLMLTNQDWEPNEMLSSDAAAEWDSQGVYAYFEFVEDSKNRRHVKDWWTSFLLRRDDP